MKEVEDFADGVKIVLLRAACRTKDTAGCVEGQWSVIQRFNVIQKQMGIPVIHVVGFAKQAT